MSILFSFFFYSLSFMKRANVIEADKPIPSQLRIVQFNDGSPYETLHALVSKAITPYFKSYVKESGRADRYSYFKIWR